MEFEVIVGNTDEIDDRPDAFRCGPDGCRIIGIPCGDLGERIRGECVLERLAGASDDAVRLMSGVKSGSQALADGSGGAEKCDLAHGKILALTHYWMGWGFWAIRSAKRGSVRRLANSASV